MDHVLGPPSCVEEHRLVHQLDPILIQGEVARNGRDLAKVFAVGEARNAVLSEVDELKLLTLTPTAATSAKNSFRTRRL